jgi:hypothetical protein
MVSSGPRMAPPTVAPAASGVATSYTADSRSALAKPSHERARLAEPDPVATADRVLRTR